MECLSLFLTVVFRTFIHEENNAWRLGKLNTEFSSDSKFRALFLVRNTCIYSHSSPMRSCGGGYYSALTTEHGIYMKYLFDIATTTSLLTINMTACSYRLCVYVDFHYEPLLPKRRQNKQNNTLIYVACYNKLTSYCGKNN